MNDPQQLPLKDIHLPEPISWWPPAPGWWILLGLVILGTLGTFYWRRRRRLLFLSAVSMSKRELAALQESYRSHEDAGQFVSELSILLRRLSISAFPREETAGLTGDAWLRFLDSIMTEKLFSEGSGRILIEAPYRANIDLEEVQPLVDACEKWIDNVARQDKVSTK
ncbi:MAG: DUF4381 family protein [Gammaproteobacteria bacterium]|nr:DUF4381 family protein [Gammaproteobacteria bacterium]